MCKTCVKDSVPLRANLRWFWVNLSMHNLIAKLLDQWPAIIGKVLKTNFYWKKNDKINLQKAHTQSQPSVLCWSPHMWLFPGAPKNPPFSIWPRSLRTFALTWKSHEFLPKDLGFSNYWKFRTLIIGGETTKLKISRKSG